MQPDSLTTTNQMPSLTDVLVRLHTDQTLLEDEHKKTQDKLTEMVKQLNNQALTSEQLSALQAEFMSVMQGFDQVLAEVKTRLKQTIAENGLQ